MIEVATNPPNFICGNSANSIVFWDKIKNNKAFELIFENYKSETLKKYWNLISNIDQQKLQLTIYQNIDEINSKSFK